MASSGDVSNDSRDETSRNAQAHASESNILTLAQQREALEILTALAHYGIGGFMPAEYVKRSERLVLATREK